VFRRGTVTFEALLGDKSEGLKANGLAFREMMLGHVIEGGFRHPNSTFFYYDQIRSVAVYGGQAPDVPRKVAAQFEWAVRDALANYLALARQQSFSKRGSAQISRFGMPPGCRRSCNYMIVDNQRSRIK
jgi:hypothetical protein